MKNVFSEDNAKEDIEGIKKDIESLTHRLNSLKDHSIENLASQIENLGDVISNMKNKGIDMGKNQLAWVYSSTRKHPLRSLMWAFTIGVTACCLCKKMLNK